jgi:hypothetical protein
MIGSIVGLTTASTAIAMLVTFVLAGVTFPLLNG